MAVTGRRVVQELHGVLANVWAKMGVALGHGDRGVTHQLLHCLDGRLPHHEVAGESVPEHVPADATQASSFACTPEGVLALPLREHAAVVLAEDDLATKVTMTLQRSEHVITERNLSRLAILGRGDGGVPVSVEI